MFQASLLSVALLALPIDLLLRLAVRYGDQSPVLESLLTVLLSPLPSLVLSLGIPVGLGALAVYILERVDRSSITAGSLWGLVLCVALMLLVEQWLISGSPGFGMTELVLIAVGVFWKGRPHWRSYSRW